MTLQSSKPAVPGGRLIPGHFPVEKYRDMQRRPGLARIPLAGHRALVKHAPERMLRASNWPRRKILVDNPAEPYAFP